MPAVRMEQVRSFIDETDAAPLQHLVVSETVFSELGAIRGTNAGGHACVAHSHRGLHITNYGVN